jgi:hypothetical protein
MENGFDVYYLGAEDLGLSSPEIAKLYKNWQRHPW